jgi:hypothetical protein
MRGQHADAVREHAVKQYIDPARKAGQQAVKIRAGDVHAALDFTNRMPLVCAALTAMKFRRPNNIHLVKTEGPGQSTTTTFTFSI